MDLDQHFPSFRQGLSNRQQLLALGWNDDALVLRRGRLVESGPVAEIAYVNGARP